jgi:hypothetical protein
LRIIRKRSGPTCQWPTSAHGHVFHPTCTQERSGGVVTARHLTPARSAARHFRSTRRACDHRPVCPYLVAVVVRRGSIPSTSTPPHASSLFCSPTADCHRREPTTVSLLLPFAPNRVPHRLGLLPCHFPADQRLPASRIWPVSHRRRGKFSPPLFLRSRAEMPKGAGPLGQAGLVMLWAEPKCTVPFFI